MSVSTLDRVRVKGYVSPGFEAVRETFADNFSRRGELMRRIDPRHRSLGQFFQDEIATPIGLDVYIRLPETIPNARLAALAPPGPLQMLIGFPPHLAFDGINRRARDASLYVRERAW